MINIFRCYFFLVILSLFVSPVSADIVINEFMASNDTTLDDEDGDSSDWIELFNNGPTAVSLGGWYLTDDDSLQSKWKLPSVVIDNNAYLLLFASKKDRVSGTELHTDFSLKAGGEYIGLIMPDGVTVADEYAPEYPAQFADQSFGKIAGTSDSYLATPTPGEVNSAEAIPVVNFPAPSGVFQDSITVSLVATISLKPGDSIRYTTNGQEPVSTSSLYNGPLTLNNTTRLRARVFRSSTGGQVTYASYTKISQQVASFNSNLPIIIIDTFSQAVSNSENYTPTLVTVFDTVGGSASLTDTPDYAGFSGLRIRGSSSRNFPKKQYKLELWDDTQEDKDDNLLGLGKESDWVLYAPGRYDRSMIANPFMYQISGDAGLVQVDTRFVEVYLNDGSGPIRQSDYEGLYVLTETIKIDKNRVPVKKMSQSDTSLPEITGGYIFSIDRRDDDEYHFKTNRGVPSESYAYLNIRRPKIVDLNSAQQNYFKGYIQSFEDTLYSSGFNHPVTGYSSYIDVPSWVDAHILRMFSMDPDILRLSNYFYKDRDGKIFNAPLWDFDRTLNSDDSRDDNPAKVWSGYDGVNPVSWDWWGRLFESENFDFRYRARWAELRSTVLSETNLFSLIDTMESEITNAYSRDNARWGSTNGYGSRYGDLRGEINALKNWISARLNFMDTYWEVNTINLAPQITHPGSQANFLGGIIILELQASDPEGDNMAYFANGLPQGLSIDASSGVISGVLSQVGDYQVAITITDGKNDVEIAFNWNVDISAPVINICDLPPVSVGGNCAGEVIVRSANDLDAYVASNYGRTIDANNKPVYMNLRLLGDLGTANQPFIASSPCAIILNSGSSVSGTDITLHARHGLSINWAADINATGEACLISDMQHALLNGGNTVNANALAIRGAKKAVVGFQSTLSVNQAVELQSMNPGDESFAKVGNKSIVTSERFTMSADNHVELAYEGSVSATSGLSIASGNLLTSETLLGHRSSVQAGTDLSLNSGGKTSIGFHTFVSAGANLGVNARIEADCVVASITSMTYSSKSGNCSSKLP